MPSPKGDSSIISQEAQGMSQKGQEKRRATEDGVVCMQHKDVFRTEHHCCLPELAEAVVIVSKMGLSAFHQR